MSLDKRTHLDFPLEVDDGWPPVGLESLPVRASAAGYEIQEAPLFVRDISVGDVLDVSLDDEGRVVEYRHLIRSKSSTIWLLCLHRTRANVLPALSGLRQLGCDTVSLETLGCYAVSVPETVSMAAVDPILDAFDEEIVAVAFPSFRHPD